MNIAGTFPSKYLKASDADSGDLIVTIRDVKMESVGLGKEAEEKPIVYFVEQAKGLVLNKTNANMIVQIAESGETRDWKGIQIRLIAAEVEFQGKPVMSLRVRPVTKGPKLGRPTLEPKEAIVGGDVDDPLPF